MRHINLLFIYLLLLTFPDVTHQMNRPISAGAKRTVAHPRNFRDHGPLSPYAVWKLPSTAEWLVSSSSSKQVFHSCSVRLESKSRSQRVWKLAAHDVGCTSFFTSLPSLSSSLRSTTPSPFVSSSANFHSTTGIR